MLKQFFVRLLAGACALAALTSCGGSRGEGTADFSTVQATIGGPGTGVTASLASSWLDSTGATTSTACGGNTPVFTDTTAVYTVTSTPYTPPDTSTGTGTTTTVTPSPLAIRNITVTLTPDVIPTVPALPSGYQTFTSTSSQPSILPGTTQQVTVNIAPIRLKQFLANDILLPNGTTGLLCTGQAPLTYRAYVSFDIVESNTGREATIQAPGFTLVTFGQTV